MYYETQWIDGVLMERFSPDGEWHCVDIKSHIESLKRSNSDLWTKNTALTARIADLERENAALVARLKDAVDDIESWGAYASEYFQAKHKLNECLTAHREFLSAVSAGKEAPDA